MNVLKSINHIIHAHNLGTKVYNMEPIQELWSGYGKLLRIETDKINAIIKLIMPATTPKNPKGWNSEFAHERKLFSYQVEMNFYAQYSSHQKFAHTPKFITHNNSADLKYLIIEDLKYIDSLPKKQICEKEIESCIKWLANFHYHYLHKKSHGLWDTGTYWHFDTRKQEYESMQDGPLKQHAKLIDIKLNSCEYQTILHGDAKSQIFYFQAPK